jgi:MFS family permease
MRHIPWREVFQHLRQQSGGRLLVYLVAVQAAVQMAGPYFTPFMFKKLGLSYAQYVALILLAFIAKVIALPLWGRVAHRTGARTLIWIGGIGIVPLSAGWIVSEQLPWLVCLQVVGGITWAAYELAFILLFFESIREEERTSLLTVFNLINTIAWVGGALLGGAMLYACGASYTGYMVIFGVSSLCRCLSLLLLARVPAMEVEADQIGVRTVAVRPNGATIDAPVLPSLPDQTETAATSHEANV